MAFRTFKEWKQIHENMRSQESVLKCPYPKNIEFCRDWNNYINKKGDDPFTMEKWKHLERKVRQPVGRPDTTFRHNDGYNRRQGKRVEY
jgi:hypothetical protein